MVERAIQRQTLLGSVSERLRYALQAEREPPVHVHLERSGMPDPKKRKLRKLVKKLAHDIHKRELEERERRICKEFSRLAGLNT